MAIQDLAAQPPVQASWWRDYLLSYVAACGVAEGRRESLATEMAQQIRGHGWTHVGLGAIDGLRAVAALGLPMGVVSNSDGHVEGDLHSLGVCYVPVPADGLRPPAPGVPVGRCDDSAVVGCGQARPGDLPSCARCPGRARGPCRPARGGQPAVRRGRALAAGLQPVHMDPHGFCPTPNGHPHDPQPGRTCQL